MRDSTQDVVDCGNNSRGEAGKDDATNFKDQSFGGKERKYFGTGLNE